MINFGQFQGTIFYDLRNSWVSFEDWIGIIVGVLAIRTSEANFARIPGAVACFFFLRFNKMGPRSSHILAATCFPSLQVADMVVFSPIFQRQNVSETDRDLCDLFSLKRIK
jgi:hypothetical protein